MSSDQFEGTSACRIAPSIKWGPKIWSATDRNPFRAAFWGPTSRSPMAPAIVPSAVGGPLAGRLARCSDLRGEGPLLQRLGPGTMFASLHAEGDFRRQRADLFLPLTGRFKTFTSRWPVQLPLRARWSITIPELTPRMELLTKTAKNSTIAALLSKKRTPIPPATHGPP